MTDEKGKRYDPYLAFLDAPFSEIYKRIYDLVIDHPETVLSMSVPQLLGIYSLVRDNLGQDEGEEFLTTSLEWIADAARRMDELAKASHSKSQD